MMKKSKEPPKNLLSLVSHNILYKEVIYSQKVQIRMSVPKIWNIWTKASRPSPDLKARDTVFALSFKTDFKIVKG